MKISIDSNVLNSVNSIKSRRCITEHIVANLDTDKSEKKIRKKISAMIRDKERLTIEANRCKRNKKGKRKASEIMDVVDKIEDKLDEIAEENPALYYSVKMENHYRNNRSTKKDGFFKGIVKNIKKKIRKFLDKNSDIIVNTVKIAVPIIIAIANAFVMVNSNKEA